MKFLNNLDLQQNELQNFRVQNLAAAPANPVIGQHYFNTVDNTEYVWNGTKWIDALSQGDYTFKNGITIDENRNVMLTAADADNIGGVTIGDNIDVEAGKISVKTAAEGIKGLIALASDEEAVAGTDTVKAINAKQLKVVADAVEAEAGRADAAEKANEKAIAKNAEDIAANTTAINAEVERAKAEEAKKVDKVEGKDLVLLTDIAQITTNKEGIATNKTAIETEVERAKGVEATKVDKEEGKSLVADTDIAQITTNKEDIAKNAKAIADETTRAKGAEEANATAIEGLDGRLTTAEAGVAANKKAIETEATTARAAEKQNADDIDALEGRMATAEGTIADNTKAIGDEKTRAEKAEKANADAIEADKQDLATFKQTVADTYVPLAQKGVANGIATLDDNGLVPAAQLPSYVDDVVDLVAIGVAPATAKVGEKYYNTAEKKIYVATAENTWGNAADPEADKIYVNIADNMSYRWSGTTLVQIGADKLKGFNGTIVGDGAKTTFDINHNLGTRNVVFEIYEAAAPYEKVYVQVLHTSTTALQVVFSQAPAVGTDYNVTVIAIA